MLEYKLTYLEMHYLLRYWYPVVEFRQFYKRHNILICFLLVQAPFKRKQSATQQRIASMKQTFSFKSSPLLTKEKGNNRVVFPVSQGLFSGDGHEDTNIICIYYTTRHLNTTLNSIKWNMECSLFGMCLSSEEVFCRLKRSAASTCSAAILVVSYHNSAQVTLTAS